MKVNPLKNFSNMSKGAKIATISAGTVAIAGVATTAIAYARGKKKIDNKELKNIEKFTTPIKEGYKEIGNWISTKATAAKDAIMKFFKKSDK